MSFAHGNGEEGTDSHTDKIRIINQNRRARDSIWDFFHLTDSQSPPRWIGDTIGIIRGELPPTLNQKYALLLNRLEVAPWTYLHYAVWFTCLTMYSAMTDFLVYDPSIKRANQKLLGIFLAQKLPTLVHKWLSGHYASTLSFVMHVRAEYCFDVGCLV